MFTRNYFWNGPGFLPWYNLGFTQFLGHGHNKLIITQKQCSRGYLSSSPPPIFLFPFHFSSFVCISQKPNSFESQLIGLDYCDEGVVDPKPTGKNKRVNKWGWTSKETSQKTVVGLAKPSSLFDENLHMVYLIHQLSLSESMVKYTQKVMN